MRLRYRLPSLVAARAFLLLAVVRAFAAAPDARLPIPDVAAQAKAQTAIDEMAGGDLASRPPAQQAAAAATLLQAAEEKQDDAAATYVLLKECLDLACASGAVETAVSASQRIAVLYAVDGPKLELDSLARVGVTASKLESCERLADAAALLADRFAGQEHWESLGRLATIAETSAMATNSPQLLEKTRSHFQALHELHTEFDQVHAAGQALNTNPDEPAANLTMGRYLCLVAAKWEQGLTLLAKSKDATLKSIAVKDLVSPTTAEPRALLGDGWWSLAGSQTGADRFLAEQRAYHWYQLAAPEVKGLRKLQVQKHIATCRADIAAFYRVNATYAARDEIRATSGRFAIEFADTAPFPQEAIAADTTLPPIAKPYRIAEMLKVTGTITLSPGTEIRGGTIDMGTKGHVAAQGEPDKPVIFRNVTFVQDLNASVVANDTVFDQCVFRKGGVWFSYFSSKWKFNHCVLYKCKFAQLTGVDYGFQFQNCLLVSMDLPEINPGKHPSNLRSQWNKIESCEFLDCAVPPTVFWCGESSNFVGCMFVPGKVNDPGKPLQVNAFVSDTIGGSPEAAWTNVARTAVEATDPGEPFETLSIAGDVPIPEINGSDYIRTLRPHLVNQAGE